MSVDFDKLPRFAELPVQEGAPPDSAWGVFGDGDELGCLNLLTPEGIVEAAGLVKSGKVFRLDAKVGAMHPPMFGRAVLSHKVMRLNTLVHDDLLDNFNTQESSQWDGFGHMAHKVHDRFYGGVRQAEIKSGPDGRLGIHRWADRFVGKGVLIDAAAWRRGQGRPVEPFDNQPYTLDELKAALAAQAGAIRPGSVLLVRTGWMEAYQQLPLEKQRAMAPREVMRAIGVDSSRAMVEWLWDSRIAAIGCDCPAVEAVPFNLHDDLALHHRTLSMIGLPLGELFVLAPLAEDCAADGRYEFMLVSAPLVLEGGIASPPNAVAIK